MHQYEESSKIETHRSTLLQKQVLFCLQTRIHTHLLPLSLTVQTFATQVEDLLKHNEALSFQAHEFQQKSAILRPTMFSSPQIGFLHTCS